MGPLNLDEPLCALIDKAHRGYPTKRFVNLELSGEEGNLTLRYSLNQ
jgi:hypothetical protein